jgi:hypothetical protein
MQYVVTQVTDVARELVRINMDIGHVVGSPFTFMNLERKRFLQI